MSTYNIGDFIWLENKEPFLITNIIMNKPGSRRAIFYQGYHLGKEYPKTVKEMLNSQPILTAMDAHLPDLIRKKIIPETLKLYLAHSFRKEELRIKLTFKERKQLLSEYNYV